MAHAATKSLHAPTGPPLYCEIDGLEVDVDGRSLSTAGCFIQTIDPTAVDTEMELFLRSPIGSASVHATVVRVVDCQEATRKQTTPGFGVLFTDLDDEARLFLEHTTEVLQRALTPVPPAPAPDIAPGTAGKTAKPQPGAHAARAVDATARTDPKAPGPSTEAPRVRRQLDEALRREGQRAPWRVLGVAADASIAEAKLAFLRHAKSHHPHVYARYQCAQVSQVATQLFILYKRAYSDFCREASRRAGTPADSGGAGTTPAARKPRRPRSTRPYQQGQQGQRGQQEQQEQPD